jgi:hypothetical protein
MANEAKIVQQCRKYLISIGYYPINLITVTPSGIPDGLYISPEGKTLWIEYKDPHGRLSKIQEYRIEQLRKYKQTVWVIRSLEELKEKLNGEW